MGQRPWSESPFYEGLTPDDVMSLYESTCNFLRRFPNIPVEDTAMDAMINASQGSFAVRGADPIRCRRSFLYRTAKNLVSDYFNAPVTRTLRTESPVVSLDETLGWDDRSLHERVRKAPYIMVAPDAEMQAFQNEVRRIVDENIDKLHSPFRIPLRQYHLEDRSFKEIAEYTGMPLGSVCTRVMRGSKRLQELLLAQGYDLQDLLPM